MKDIQKGIILMIISSVLVCFGQLFWKLYYGNTIVFLLLGFVCYGAGTILMLSAYKFGKLSILHPILGLNYVLTIVLGRLVLQEVITPNKIVGIFIILVGISIISWEGVK